jgi:hypothetical protein
MPPPITRTPELTARMNQLGYGAAKQRAILSGIIAPPPELAAFIGARGDPRSGGSQYQYAPDSFSGGPTGAVLDRGTSDFYNQPFGSRAEMEFGLRGGPPTMPMQRLPGRGDVDPLGYLGRAGTNVINTIGGALGDIPSDISEGFDDSPLGSLYRNIFQRTEDTGGAGTSVGGRTVEAITADLQNKNISWADALGELVGVFAATGLEGPEAQRAAREYLGGIESRQEGFIPEAEMLTEGGAPPSITGIAGENFGVQRGISGQEETTTPASPLTVTVENGVPEGQEADFDIWAQQQRAIDKAAGPLSYGPRLPLKTDFSRARALELQAQTDPYGVYSRMSQEIPGYSEFNPFVRSSIQNRFRDALAQSKLAQVGDPTLSFESFLGSGGFEPGSPTALKEQLRNLQSMLVGGRWNRDVVQPGFGTAFDRGRDGVGVELTPQEVGSPLGTYGAGGFTSSTGQQIGADEAKALRDSIRNYFTSPSGDPRQGRANILSALMQPGLETVAPSLRGNYASGLSNAFNEFYARRPEANILEEFGSRGYF